MRDNDIINRRLATLSAHLQSRNSSEPFQVGTAKCAATQRVCYARPEAPCTAFGEASDDDHAMRATELALRYAEQTLSMAGKRQASDRDVIYNSFKAIPGMSTSLEPAFAQPAKRDLVAEGRDGAALAAFRGLTHTLEKPRSSSTPAEQRSGIQVEVQVQASQRRNTVELRVALPGVKAGDVRVEVRGRRIIVTGRKAAEGEGTLGRALALIESGIFGTLPTGRVAAGALISTASNESFMASCPLPQDADTSTARATLADGMLCITMRRNV